MSLISLCQRCIPLTIYPDRSGENVATIHIDPSASDRNVAVGDAIEGSQTHEPVERKTSRFEVIKTPDAVTNIDVFPLAASNGDVQRSQELQQQQLMTLLPTPDPPGDTALVQSHESEEV